jgi:5-oxoprolinase (ATP-hydrolysing)
VSEAAGGRGAEPAGWQVWIDTGGTFTDCLALDPAGVLHRAKVLSTSALRGLALGAGGAGGAEGDGRFVRLASRWRVPRDFFRGFTLRLLESEDAPVLIAGSAEGGGSLTLAAPLAGSVNGKGRPGEAAVELRSPEEAPILAARLVTGTPPGVALPPLAMRLATTRGTNALLERKGAATALFITRGFGDLLRIGTQQRPDLFALDIRRPPPLYSAVVEVPERLAADGSVLEPLDCAALREPAARLLAEGFEAAAVALLHSYRNPRHELELGEMLAAIGFRHVALSAVLAPLIKLLPRAETAVVDAYLAPALQTYLESVAAPLAGGSLHVMTSAGGLVRAASFRAKDGLLSGPAGGVVGAAQAGRRSGLARIIAFDMGGTSTDVARHDGDFEYLFEHGVGDAHLVSPALAIESVAAGGGSVCSFDGGRLRVGPESAGARPGPACYGAGGPLTLTDVNLALGRLDPDRFEIPLAAAASERAIADLLAAMAAAGQAAPREEVLEGLLEIANERMAEAIRAVSLARGYDPAEYALVAFGGAGAQHACAVAGLLGVGTVLVPADAGLLSALGLGAAVIERFAERQVLAPLAAVVAELEGWLDELGREACRAVVAEGVAAAGIAVRRRLLNLRFTGQEAALTVEHTPGMAVAPAFAAAYRAIYGYEPEGRAIEVESLRVVASAAPPRASPAPDAPDGPDGPDGRGGPDGPGSPGDPGAAVASFAAGDPGVVAPPAEARVATAQGRRRCRFGGAWREVPVFDRPALAPGDLLRGPALVFERHTATAVEDGWELWVDGAGGLLLRRRWEDG